MILGRFKEPNIVMEAYSVYYISRNHTLALSIFFWNLIPIMMSSFIDNAMIDPDNYKQILSICCIQALCGQIQSCEGGGRAETPAGIGLL